LLSGGLSILTLKFFAMTPKTMKAPKRQKINIISSRAANAYDTDETLEKLNRLFSEAAKAVLFRSAELLKFKLALLTGRNVLFLGRPGVAKTRMVDVVFKGIESNDPKEPLVYYSRQCRRGMLEDDVFGPLNPKKYRDEGVFEYITDGRLPKAHFAYLDELPNAPDHVRAGLLGILNEHRFHNGRVEETTPLITAVATANRLPTSDCEYPFLDRWLFVHTVQPSSTAADLLQIMDVFTSELEGKPKHSIDDNVTVTLNELRFLHTAARSFTLKRDIKELYVEVVTAISSAFEKHPDFRSDEMSKLTERRICWGSQVLKSALMLHALNNEGEIDEGAALVNAASICNIDGNPERDKIIDSVCNAIVGMRIRAKSELPDARNLKAATLAMVSKYDAGLSLANKHKLLSTIEELIATMDEEMAGFSVPEAVEIKRECANRLNNTKTSLLADIARAGGTAPQTT